MALDAQGQALHTLQQYPGVEGGDGGARVAQDDGADAGHKGGRACHIGKDGSVIRGVGLGQGGILVGMGLEVKLAAVHYHAAQRAAMAAYELGGTVHHHVGPMLEGTDEQRREGVVDNEEDAMAVCHLGYGIQVGHVAIGVAEGLGIDDLGVGAYCGLQGLQVVDIDDAVLHALGAQRVGDEIEGATVEVVGRHYVVTILQHVLQGIGHGRGTAGHCQAGHSTLQGSHTTLKDILGAVGQATIDVARVTQPETVSSMLRVVEHITGGLVDGHCASVACGVGGLLTNVQCQSLKVQFLICCHSCILLLFVCIIVIILLASLLECDCISFVSHCKVTTTQVHQATEGIYYRKQFYSYAFCTYIYSALQHLATPLQNNRLSLSSNAFPQSFPCHVSRKTPIFATH